MVEKKDKTIFEKIVLGQTVLKFKTPVEVLDEINLVYQNKFDQLPNSNYQLVGKIKKEKSIYYTFKGKEHNFLSRNVLRFFESCFRTYLVETKQTSINIKVTTIWINEMHKHEYNPVHTHVSATSKLGLSSVMFLKNPNTYGEEYARKDKPFNGKLHLMGNIGGQFVTSDYYPEAVLGDFYIFPFDMKHCVYPFNSTDEGRRTLSANCDFYDSGYKRPS
tara:strand:+ start:75 stop:731 length:657 start_codon:yes stop_codon:yes gene_type:complete